MRTLALFLLLIAAFDGFAACVNRIVPEGSSSRVVVLAGGDAWPLFQQYLSLAKRQNVKVALSRTKVFIWSKGRQESLEIGWAKMLTGESMEHLWEKQLTPRKAEIHAELLERARSSSWDVVCVAPTAGATRRPPNPPTPPGDTAGASVLRDRPASSVEALTYFKSGMQYAGRADYTNALKEFALVEKLDPRYPDLLMNMGVAHMQLKDFVRASRYMTRAIEQDPKNPRAHFNLACLQARLGQSDDAIASLATSKALGLDLTKTMRVDPDFNALRGRKDFEALFERAKEK